MRRRDFIILGGATVALPHVAGAQQPGTLKRIAFIHPAFANPASRSYFDVWQRTLESLGWTESKNVAIDLHWAEGDTDKLRQLVAKALEFAPNDPFIVDSLGWVEFRSGNFDEALEILQDAYQKRPDPEIAAHLGEVLWRLDLRERAISIWNEGLGLNSQNDTLLETMKRLNPS